MSNYDIRQPVIKRTVGGEYSTVVSAGYRPGTIVVETILFNDDGTTGKAVRDVISVHEIQANHIEEINRRGGN